MQAIRDIAGKSKYSTVCGKVVSTDGATCKVVRLLDGKTYENVRLNATSLVADGLVIAPKSGSYVSITSIDGETWFVSQYSQIESVTLNVEADVEINGGENGGLCITPKLKEQLDKMTARIDGIIDAINNATPTPQDGGTALQTSMKLLLATLVDRENFEGIENDRVKH
jgi:hypothetical protein